MKRDTSHRQPHQTEPQWRAAKYKASVRLARICALEAEIGLLGRAATSQATTLAKREDECSPP